MERIALVDVDGTLVDTNYQHALAWYRAFRRIGLTLPLWRIHRHIGMGGDQLVPALTDEAVDARHGDELRAAWAEEFAPLLPEVSAVEGAHELLAGLRSDGVRVVLASSGKPEHVDAFLDLVDGRSVANAWTTSEDVEHTKPAPDLLQVALDKATDRPGDADVVVVGDSTWDFVAAGRFGARGVALLTGGFSREELTEAGAVEVADTLPEVGRLLHRGWR
ncbi:MAG TPA: HAD family hydrolase [Actinomycetes bacterium]|nr:HAD family hydrolase [Actinomycetes bacterium]